MDLTSLHHLGALVQDARAGTGTGQPLAIALDKIIPGENPRTTFDNDYLHRLAASIKARGVKTPISVQPVTADEVALSFGRRGLVPPVDLDGFYKINHGECRYRAAVIANKETIPAMLDEQHDGIDALVENIQRKDLDPLDIAQAIQQKVNQGWKKADIAREI
jgi:ParB family chromosome partitioning protein